MTHAPNSGEIELRIVEEEEGDQEKATVSPGRSSVRVQLPIDSPSASVESDSSSGSGVVEPSTPISDNCPSTSTSSEESSATPTATYVKEEDSSNNRYKYHKQQSYSNRRSSSVSTPSIYTSSPATRTSDLWPRISLCLRTSARKIECIPVIGSLTRWCLYRRQRRYSHSGASTASNATPQRRGQALNAPSSVGGGIRSSPRSVHMLNPSPSSSTSRSGCDKFTILSILFVCLLVYTLFPDFLANSLPALNQFRKGADGGGLNTVYLQERAAGLTHSIVDSLKISHDHDNYQDTNSNNNNNNGGNNSSNENNIPLIHTNPSVVDDSSSNMKATNDASPKTVAEDVPTPKSVVVDSPTPVVIAETPAVANEASAVTDVSDVETAAADGDTDSYTPITEAKEEWMVEHIPMIPPDAEFPADSTAETLMLKPKDDKDMSHAYHICTFTNVCLSPDGVQFRFQNHNSWLEMSEMAKKCENQEFYWASKLCRCFHYAFKPLVLPYEFYTDVTQSLVKVRAADKARGDGKNSLDRRYPDPFLHVTEARHEHYWSIHKWVPHHHIAHWAQKLMIMQSIFQHQEAFTDILPPISGLAFHDTSNTHPPLEDHLLNIFNFSVEASFARRRPSTSSDGTGRRSREWAHPLVWNSNDPIKEMNHLLDPDNGRTIWYEDLVSHRYSTSLKLDECKNNPQRCSLPNPAYEKALNELKPDQLKKLEDGTVEPLLPLQSSDGHDIPSRIPNPQLHTCFNRVSMSPIYGLLSLDRRDSDMFRSVTAKRMGLSTRSNRCPPRRAILLTRSDRKILNVDELLAFMKQTYRLDVELHEITGKNSSAEQIHLFATTGLILSSHSSQMINVMFSHPGQSLVEITPEWYNIDFGAYAHVLGLNFNYALGGHIPKSHSEDSRQSPDYTYVSDPNMLECTQSLQSECPSGDSWCFKRHNQRLCSKVNQWPNKQMNFYANMTAVKLAVHQSMSHIQDQCFGKW